jgi:hypothetical protein
VRATLRPSTTDAVISIEQVLGSPAITNVNGVGQRIPYSRRDDSGFLNASRVRIAR